MGKDEGHREEKSDFPSTGVSETKSLAWLLSRTGQLGWGTGKGKKHLLRWGGSQTSRVYILLISLSRIRWPCLYGITSHPGLFHQSICLFWCQQHTLFSIYYYYYYFNLQAFYFYFNHVACHGYGSIFIFFCLFNFGRSYLSFRPFIFLTWYRISLLDMCLGFSVFHCYLL